VNAGLEVKNIVLVHGGFVDGSGWQGVYDHLTADGYRVAVVQNPTLSLAGDVAATHQVLDGLDGPAVLVGHSYGGAVITEAGNHEKIRLPNETVRIAGSISAALCGRTD
jgi:pimeloyl-ACP methyl ester carboxylesterase